MEQLKKTGIYKILNKINGYIYIGSAAGKYGIYQRFMDHKKCLRDNRHHNMHLQRSWNKYGEENFQFEVIEFCEKSTCIEKEQYYINTLKPKFNICKIAGNTAGINCEDFMSSRAIKNKRKKQSKNISKALKNKKKSNIHAIKCGAKFFNVYKAICVRSRSRKQSAVYSKGEFVGKWLKRTDCSSELDISDKLIRRCLQGKRAQTCGYIFEYEIINNV